MTDPGPSRQSLLVERFERVYEDQFSYVWSSLRRLGIPERHLEDVAHDVFIVVHRQLDTYDPDRPIKPWLFGIAFRVASDHKKKKANQEVLEEDVSVADPAPGPEALHDAADRRRLVMRALDALDDDRRAVFVMHEIDELSAPDIAGALGIPVNTVYSRLRIAKERFADAVRRWSARDRGSAS